jgi:hypothetical protein
MAAVGIGAIAAVLTGLSLSHLASGISLVTAAEDWQSWSLAIGVDLSFIGLELAQIMASTEHVRRSTSGWARPAIACTLAGSAVMNAFAFAQHADGYIMTAAAVTMGCAIPALIYVLMRVGAALYIDCSVKRA